MQQVNPTVLIVTTQTWMQLTRMALRLTRYGCPVSVLGPPRSELRFFAGLKSWHLLQHGAPLDALQTAITRSGATVLLPGDDLAVWLLHALHEHSPRHRDLVERSIGPSSSFTTVLSRYKLLSLAASLGIAVPETAPAYQVQDARQWCSQHTPPFVLKKDGTFGGGGVEIVHDLSELDQHYARLNAIPSTSERTNASAGSSSPALPHPWGPDAELSVQSYIPGVAANAMFACDQGRILGNVQARVVAAKGQIGPALMIELVDDERMATAGRLIAASLGLSGFFGLDFVLEQETGTPFLVEMNPRCTRLGHTAVANQTDLAGLLWACWSSHPAPPPASGDLTPFISYYPEAMLLDPLSSFHEHARLDVPPEDRASVDKLALGSPALLARAYRPVRSALKTIKHTFLPPLPLEPLYYFKPPLPADAPHADPASFAAQCAQPTIQA